MKNLLCLILVLFLSLPVFAEYKPIPKELSKQYRAEIEQIIDKEYPKIIQNIDNSSIEAQKEYENIINNGYKYLDYINLANILETKIVSYELSLYKNILQITQEKYLKIKSAQNSNNDIRAYNKYLEPYFKRNRVNTRKLNYLKKYRQGKSEVIKNYLKEIRERGSIEEQERESFFKNYSFGSKKLSQQYKTEMEQIIDEEYPKIIQNIDNDFSDAVRYCYDIKTYGNTKKWYENLEYIFKEKVPNSDKELYQKLVYITLNKYLGINLKPYFENTEYIFNAYLKYLFNNNDINYQKLTLINEYKNAKIKILKKNLSCIEKIYFKNLLKNPLREGNYKPIPKELRKQYKAEMEQIINEEYSKIIEYIDDLVLQTEVLNERLIIYGDEDTPVSPYTLRENNSNALLGLYKKLMKVTQEKYLKVSYQPFNESEEPYLNFLSSYLLDNKVNTKKIIKLEFYKQSKKDFFEQYYNKSGELYSNEYELREFYFRKYRPVPKELSKKYKEEIEQIIKEEYPKIIQYIDEEFKSGKILYKKLMKNGYNLDDYCNLNLTEELVIPTAELHLYDKLAKVTNEKYLGIKHIPYGTDWVGLYEEYLYPYFKDNNVNKKLLDKIVNYEVKKMIIIKKYVKIVEKTYPNRY